MGQRMAVFNDPTGAHVSIWRPPSVGMSLGSFCQAGATGWTNCTPGTRPGSFEVFGWGVEELPDMPFGKYWSV